jgi:hypothetical protein
LFTIVVSKPGDSESGDKPQISRRIPLSKPRVTTPPNEDDVNLRVTLGSTAKSSAVSAAPEGTKSQAVITETPVELASSKREWEGEGDVTVGDGEARKVKRANTGKISQNVNVARAVRSFSAVKVAQKVKSTLTSSATLTKSEGNGQMEEGGQNVTILAQKMVQPL